MFGNLVTDAMRTATDSDVEVTNGGVIRGDKKIAHQCRACLQGFSDQTALRQQDRETLLDRSPAPGSAGDWCQSDGRNQGQTLPGFRPSFPDGAAKQTGSRVVDVTIGGAALDKAKTYSMANNDFLARGSGGYSGSRGPKMLIDTKSGAVMASQVINHVSRPDNI